MDQHTIRGVDLAVEQSGGGDRELVFVHGFQNDHTGWRPLVERLDGESYRFTSFDLPGCGASGAVDSSRRCTIDEYGADLTALCDELGLDRPVLIGHSLGAVTALSAALARPGRFGGVVLMAPASTSGLDFLPDEASFEALAYPSAQQRRALATAAFRQQPPEAYLRELLEVVERATPEHVEGAAWSMREFRRQDELAALDVPAILLCGDRDKHVPLRNHLATHGAIPRCGLQVYYDIGHVPFVETPERCAADVERFLAAIT